MNYLEESAKKYLNRSAASYKRAIEHYLNIVRLENELPDKDLLDANFADIKVDFWGDIRVVIPWNNANRLKIIEHLESLGWRQYLDFPREPHTQTWKTCFASNGSFSQRVELDLIMSAEYVPDELENACQVINLGKKVLTTERNIYDVICGEDNHE